MGWAELGNGREDWKLQTGIGKPPSHSWVGKLRSRELGLGQTRGRPQGRRGWWGEVVGTEVAGGQGVGGSEGQQPGSAAHVKKSSGLCSCLPE